MDASTIPRETSREAASLSVDEGWIAVGTILKWHSCVYHLVRCFLISFLFI